MAIWAMPKWTAIFSHWGFGALPGIACLADGSTLMMAKVGRKISWWASDLQRKSERFGARPVLHSEELLHSCLANTYTLVFFGGVLTIKLTWLRSLTPEKEKPPTGFNKYSYYVPTCLSSSFPAIQPLSIKWARAGHVHNICSLIQTNVMIDEMVDCGQVHASQTKSQSTQIKCCSKTA